ITTHRPRSKFTGFNFDLTQTVPRHKTHDVNSRDQEKSVVQTTINTDKCLIIANSKNPYLHIYGVTSLPYTHIEITGGRAKCARCGENWKRFGVKCYFFSPDFLNWTNSRDRCVKMGGHLIIITSQAEQTFVSTGLGKPHWIGLNDLETEGKWMWVNNQPLTDTGVTFWSTIADGADEPNNWKEENPAGENCASLGDEKGRFRVWFDASCSKTRKYICEK
uniref:C-type lectin domain-containing protein n=1 Tax=Astyanax mexicanus TaxID=7994 RepID=W5K0P4_ASTMX